MQVAKVLLFAILVYFILVLLKKRFVKKPIAPPTNVIPTKEPVPKVEKTTPLTVNEMIVLAGLNTEPQPQPKQTDESTYEITDFEDRSAAQLKVYLDLLKDYQLNMPNSDESIGYDTAEFNTEDNVVEQNTQDNAISKNNQGNEYDVLVYLANSEYTKLSMTQKGQQLLTEMFGTHAK